MQREGLFAQKQLEENAEFEDELKHSIGLKLISIRAGYQKLKDDTREIKDQLMEKRDRRNGYGLERDSLKQHNDIVTCLMLKVYYYYRDVIDAEGQSQPITSDLWRKLTVLYMQNFHKITRESVTEAISELMTEVAIATADAERNIAYSDFVKIGECDDTKEKCVIC